MELIGQKCTQAELLDIVTTVDTTGRGEITWDDFYGLFKQEPMETPDKNPDGGSQSRNPDGATSWLSEQQAEMISAFATFDREKLGVIPIETLAQVQTNLGEKLSQDDLEDLQTMCSDAGLLDDNGRIDYRSLIVKLYNSDSG